MRLLTVLVGFLVLLIITTSVCQDDGDADDPVDDVREDREPEASASEEDEDENEAEGVSTYCIFPNHQLRRFAAGEVAEALIGFENQNEDSLHVEYIRGSLTSPVDFTYYIQNFTGAMHNSTVASGEEVSLLYRFKADISIEPRQYGLILQVFYTSNDNETFLSTVFNSTIDITDPASSFDGKTIFAYLSIIGMLGLVGYAVFKLVQKGKLGKKGTRATKAAVSTQPVSTSAPPPGVRGAHGVDWDYISPEHRQYVTRRRQSSPNTSPQRSRTSPTRSS